MLRSRYEHNVKRCLLCARRIVRTTLCASCAAFIQRKIRERVRDSLAGKEEQS